MSLTVGVSVQTCINVVGKFKVCAQVPNTVHIVTEPVAKNNFSYDTLLIFFVFLSGTFCVVLSVVFFLPWCGWEVTLQAAGSENPAAQVRSEVPSVEDLARDVSILPVIAESEAPVPATS